MISLETFATAIQAGLNLNGGISFRIFVDAAAYEKAKKTRTEKKRYTNGLLRVGTSTIIPTQSVAVATQSVELEIVAALPTPETDNAVIKAHRAALDTYFQNFSTQLITDEVGRSYTVAAVYSLANTGTVEAREGIGTSITFYVDISYSYVENGLNSNSVKFTLDGNEIPYTSVHYRKFPTTDSNASSGASGVSYSRNSAFMRGFDFEMPALDGVPISELVLNQIDSDDLNTAHTLVKTVGTKSKTYNVIFGSAAMNLQGVNNVGLTFSLVERAPYAGGANG